MKIENIAKVKHLVDKLRSLEMTLTRIQSPRKNNVIYDDFGHLMDINKQGLQGLVIKSIEDIKSQLKVL